MASKWFTQPLAGVFSETDQRRVLDIISFVAAAALILEFAYILIAEKPVGVVLQVAFFIGLSGFLVAPWVVRATGSTAPGALILLVAMGGLILVPAYYQGGASAIFTIWFVLIPLLAGLLLGHRLAILLGVLGIAAMTTLFLLEKTGKLPAAGAGMDALPGWLNLVAVIAFSSAVGAVSALSFVASSKALKEATQADAAKARALEEAIEGIATVDSGGRFKTVNAAFSAMHGTRSENLLGTLANDWINVDDRAQIETAIRAIAVSGKEELTIRGQREDGRVFFENVVLVDMPEGELGDHYRFARDVTRQKELTEQLNQSVKMEAIGRLADGIAHDFNNLLMTILTASHQLGDVLEKKPGHGSGPELLDWISTAADRAAGLTRQLLDFSHVQDSDSGPIDVHESLERFTQILSSTIGASIVIKAEMSTKELLTVGNLARFESGLMNLALNARDAMPDGGVLRFRTTESRLDATDPRYAAFRLEGIDFVRIDVVDEGSGIEPEILEKIFDPFFTTKAVGKGTGLGLSLLYTYVREIGGALEVFSKVGVGTTVSVFLPLTLERQMRVQPENSILSLKGRETILLAEDDKAVAKLLYAVLSDAGYQVIMCKDGRHAVESFTQTSSSIGLVLLDYRMPRMDGIEAFDAIHSVSPTMPVILMSGNIPGSEIAHLGQRGLYAVLRKPCSREEVLHAVRAGIESRLERAHRGDGVS